MFFEQLGVLNICRFRGFGGPQGMLVTETWMTHVANALGRSVEELQVGDDCHRRDECTCLFRP